MLKINWDEFKEYKQTRHKKVDNFITLLDFIKSYYNYWQRLVEDKDKKNLFTNNVLRNIDINQPFKSFESICNTFNGELITEEDYINKSLHFTQ